MISGILCSFAVVRELQKFFTFLSCEVLVISSCVVTVMLVRHEAWNKTWFVVENVNLHFSLNHGIPSKPEEFLFIVAFTNSIRYMRLTASRQVKHESHNG